MTSADNPLFVITVYNTEDRLVSLIPTYEPAVDALYLCARPGVAIGETVELDPRVIVDRDADGARSVSSCLAPRGMASRPGCWRGPSAARSPVEQEIADAALSAIRGRPGAAGPG